MTQSTTSQTFDDWIMDSLVDRRKSTHSNCFDKDEMRAAYKLGKKEMAEKIADYFRDHDSLNRYWEYAEDIIREKFCNQ